MSSRLTGKFREEFELALSQEGRGPYNEVFQACMAVLREHKLLYVLEKVNPDQFLVHQKNRGGLMLSPHNVHSNAEVIYSVGADRKQLTNAFCIELGDSGKQREDNIAKNVELVRRAKGLLAEVSGSERFLTVGCGHTTAFCKLAGTRRGRTTAMKLASADGTIDLHKVYKNAEFKAMITEGWSWTVVPSDVDTAYPQFAEVAQKALNSSNHVAQLTGELEVGIYLASIVDDVGFRDAEKWEERAIQQVRDLCVPCSSYVGSILTFVCEFGGGGGAPMICFMDSVSKHFGCSNVLGETFWSTISSMVFFDKIKYYPLLRAALLLVNLAAPSRRVRDGIAVLLTKTDLGKLVSKNGEPKATACEDALRAARLISNVLIKQHSHLFDESASLEPLGQFFVRVGLYATIKGRQGREGKDYELQAIKDMYLAQLSSIVKTDVTYAPWATNGEPKAEPKADPVSSTPVTATLADHSSPLWIAQKRGFHVGTTIIEKLAGVSASVDRCYDIVSIDTKIKIVSICAYDGVHVHAEITLEGLLANWQVSTMESPVKLAANETKSSTLATDRKKAQIFLAITEASCSAAAGSLEYWRRPDMVRTGAKAIPTGSLTLVPSITLSNITFKSATGLSLGKHRIDDKTVEVFATGPPRMAFDAEKPTHVPKDATISAFWWVGTTNVKKDANVELEMKEVKGISVPVLKNHVDIQPYTRLLKFVAAQKKQASTLETTTGDAPKKKSKTS